MADKEYGCLKATFSFSHIMAFLSLCILAATLASGFYAAGYAEDVDFIDSLIKDGGQAERVYVPATEEAGEYYKPWQLKQSSFGQVEFINHEDVDTWRDGLKDLKEKPAFFRWNDATTLHHDQSVIDDADFSDKPKSYWNIRNNEFNRIHDIYKNDDDLKYYAGNPNGSKGYLQELKDAIVPEITTSLTTYLGYGSAALSFVSGLYSAVKDGKDANNETQKAIDEANKNREEEYSVTPSDALLERGNHLGTERRDANNTAEKAQLIADEKMKKEFKKNYQVKNASIIINSIMIFIAIAMIVFGAVCYFNDMSLVFGHGYGENNPIFGTIALQGLAFFSLYAIGMGMSYANFAAKKKEHVEKAIERYEKLVEQNDKPVDLYEECPDDVDSKEWQKIKGMKPEIQEDIIERQRKEIIKIGREKIRRKEEEQEESQEESVAIGEDTEPSHSGSRTAQSERTIISLTPRQAERQMQIADNNMNEHGRISVGHALKDQIVNCDAASISSSHRGEGEPKKDIEDRDNAYVQNLPGFRRLLTRPIDRIMNAIEK